MEGEIRRSFPSFLVRGKSCAKGPLLAELLAAVYIGHNPLLLLLLLVRSQ